MDVPIVKFRSLEGENLEMIDLHGLYRRRPALDHDPAMPHRVKFHMLIYIKRGRGAHQIDFQRHRFNDGCFLFVNKNQVHAFDFSNRPQGTIIIFNDQYIHKTQANMRMPLFSSTHLHASYQPVFKPDSTLRSSTEVLFAEIKKEADRAKPSSLIIMFLFSSLLLMLARARPQTPHSRLNKIQYTKFSRFNELLEKNFTHSREAFEYAQRMHTSYKSLNELCKLAAGQTAKQFIDSFIILEAKRRLVIDHTPVQQLAFDLGFDDVSNFVKFFKKHTRATPAQFRQQSIG